MHMGLHGSWPIHRAHACLPTTIRNPKFKLGKINFATKWCQIHQIIPNQQPNNVSCEKTNTRGSQVIQSILLHLSSFNNSHRFKICFQIGTKSDLPTIRPKLKELTENKQDLLLFAICAALFFFSFTITT